ncbi:hypothetical protein EV363DRAFT_1363441 [Boletus edulis]|nr:hypothetical protein EV363DRAFT_1363441 [Boletus edulis]
MSFSSTSDNYSHWLASSRPLLWPSADPTRLYLGDDSVLLPPPLPRTLSDSHNPDSDASHEVFTCSLVSFSLPLTLSLSVNPAFVKPTLARTNIASSRRGLSRCIHDSFESFHQLLTECHVCSPSVVSNSDSCSDPTSTSDLHSHMGGHIIRSIRGVPEELATPVGPVFPCGFCGSSGNPDCVIKLKKTKRATEVITDCPHKVPFKYGFAEKGSESCPCRNVPVVCALCPHRERDTDAKPAVWRYNMEQHLTLSHPEYAHPGKFLGLPLPLHMIGSVVLTIQEEKKFGVPACPERPPAHKKHESTHPLASTSSGQKRQADAGQFRIIISSSNGTKRARMAKD